MKFIHPLLIALIGVSAFVSTSIGEESSKLRIIVFGAHPDDAQYKAGGTAAKWIKAGHQVKLVSVTNGDIGHWQSAGVHWLRADLQRSRKRMP